MLSPEASGLQVSVSLSFVFFLCVYVSPCCSVLLASIMGGSSCSCRTAVSRLVFTVADTHCRELTKSSVGKL